MLSVGKDFVEMQGHVRTGEFIALYLSVLVLGFPIGRVSHASLPASSTLPGSAGQGVSSSMLHYVSPTGNDTGDGSYNHPWATIQHADRVVRPGDTVLVLDGTYKGDVTLNSSGMAEHRITYKAQNKWKAKLVGTGTGDGSAVIRLGGGYTSIEGFDITGSDANGIILAYTGTAAIFNKAIGNYVHDLITPCDSNSGTAIETGSGDNYSGISNNDMIENVIANITPYNGCPGGHQASGLFAETPYSTIANNVVINAGYGIQTWHAASHVTIYGNTLLNNLRSITVGAGDSPYGVMNDYSLVQNNIIYNSARTAIAESGKTGPHNRYIDNLIFRGDTDIRLNNGLHATGTIYADPIFINNTGTAAGNYRVQANSPAHWRVLVQDGTTSIPSAMQANERIMPSSRSDTNAAPAAGVTASATLITLGQSSTITWTTKNAISATLNGTPVPLTGSITVQPTVNTTYKIVATSATGKTDWGSATVSVRPVK
jgi:hypothetical protein